MKMRKGFTLVELLIVIVIIGILAAAMLLSSGSATASAEASNIVTNMRGLKAAAVMHYADSMDVYMNVDAADDGKIANLKQYIDNPAKIDGLYDLVLDTGTNGHWWIKYDASKTRDDVKEKIAGRAASVGLYPTQSTTGANYKNEATIFMVAR